MMNFKNKTMILSVVFGLLLTGCGSGDKAGSPSSEVSLQIDPINVVAQINLPNEVSIDKTSLTITVGIFDEQKVQANGDAPVTLNNGAVQLLTATTPAGTPLLMAVSIGSPDVKVISLDVKTTAVSLVYLQPFVAQLDLDMARSVLQVISNLPETQALAGLLLLKIQSVPEILIADDTEIASSISRAVDATLKNIAPILLSPASQKITVTPTEERSGISVIAEPGEQAGPHTLTLRNDRQRYLAAYLEDMSGLVVDFSILGSKTSFIGITLKEFKETLNVDTALHPETILKVYGPLSLVRISPFLDDPNKSRVIEPMIATAIFEFAAPIAITALGVKTGFQGTIQAGFVKSLLENLYLDIRNDTQLRQVMAQAIIGVTFETAFDVGKELVKQVVEVAIDSVVANTNNVTKNALQISGVTDPKIYGFVDNLSKQMTGFFSKLWKGVKTSSLALIETVPAFIDIAISSPLEIFNVKDIHLNPGLSAGSLDPTFGTGGKVTTDFGGTDWANALVIQTDGKIVAAGIFADSSGQSFALARYNSDGTLDPSFGTGGKVTTDFGGLAEALAIQLDGKIVAAGAGSSDFALARYNPDGTLDLTFGTGGKVTTDFGSSQDIAKALAIQADGKIVVVGGQQGSQGDFALARYNPDGTLDPTFGTGGKVTTDFEGGNGHQANALVIQADGKIVVAGVAFNDIFAKPRHFALTRYNPDGTLDTTFGTGGKVTTGFIDGFVQQGEAEALAIQSDGKLVVAGGVTDNAKRKFSLIRYNPDGTLDMTFGTEGKVTTFFGTSGSDNAKALVIQADGKIISAGSALSSNAFGVPSEFGLARYNLNGTPDTTFGTEGKVATNFGMGGGSGAEALVIQADGKLVAAGLSANASGESDFALARYLP